MTNPRLICAGRWRNRVALYVHRNAVRCRACFGLVYRSQYQSLSTRLEQRAEPIARAIGWHGESDRIVRKKGMHRTTYHRRWNEAKALYTAGRGRAGRRVGQGPLEDSEDPRARGGA